METRGLIHRWVLLGVALFVVVIRVGAQEPDHYDPDDAKTWADVVTEDRDVTVRGQQFRVHFYQSQGNKRAIPAIYACGDGGWRGLAPRTAQQLAHMGFAVAGVDSKVYLREFSSVTTPLTMQQLARDYADVAAALRSYAKVDAAAPVYVYGWSLGAGFAIAVGADPQTRSNWAGIISIGLPKQNQLVSGVGGNHTNLKNDAHAQFGFRSEDVLPRIAPVPLVMIQSTSDTASPQKVGNALFASAGNPKKYVLINASNHRFSGARDEFYTALGNSVAWIREQIEPQITRKNTD
ncbi:MAG TPA: AcvB/VirJ family lysyl-phosphatidylglycerol hydrolase [Pyrinomonadaceae bacterium]|nr:AcvB/VirJ family lysyl-phosphatidylglycerol hydrolase [Pyrinomonadaceae bacterium]